MLVYNLIKSSDNSLKISGKLWQLSRDESTVNNIGSIIDFVDDNTYVAFKLKEKKADQTGSNDTTNDEIMVP